MMDRTIKYRGHTIALVEFFLAEQNGRRIAFAVDPVIRGESKASMERRWKSWKMFGMERNVQAATDAAKRYVDQMEALK